VSASVNSSPPRPRSCSELLAGIGEDDWHDAINMDGAQVAQQETVTTFESFEHSGPRGRLLLNASLDSSGASDKDWAPRGIQAQLLGGGPRCLLLHVKHSQAWS
jgi:hypothetical protein